MNAFLSYVSARGPWCQPYFSPVPQTSTIPPSAPCPPPGDLIVTYGEGIWSPTAGIPCPGQCLDLGIISFLSTDSTNSCVCSGAAMASAYDSLSNSYRWGRGAWGDGSVSNGYRWGRGAWGHDSLSNGYRWGRGAWVVHSCVCGGGEPAGMCACGGVGRPK